MNRGLRVVKPGCKFVKRHGDSLVCPDLHASTVRELRLLAADGLKGHGEHGAGEAGNCEENGDN